MSPTWTAISARPRPQSASASASRRCAWRRWQSLIAQFTGGDDAMLGKIRAVWKDAMADPKLAPLIPLTPEVAKMMGKALAHLKGTK